jgi:hypothetical protein
MSGLYMCVSCINKSIDKVVAPEHPASSCNHSSRQSHTTMSTTLMPTTTINRTISEYTTVFKPQVTAPGSFGTVSGGTREWSLLALRLGTQHVGPVNYLHQLRVAFHPMGIDISVYGTKASGRHCILQPDNAPKDGAQCRTKRRLGHRGSFHPKQFCAVLRT